MRNSLKKIEGVRRIEVDLDDKTASVVVPDHLDVAVLIAATTNIGFPSVVRETD